MEISFEDGDAASRVVAALAEEQRIRRRSRGGGGGDIGDGVVVVDEEEDDNDVELTRAVAMVRDAKVERSACLRTRLRDAVERALLLRGASTVGLLLGDVGGVMYEPIASPTLTCGGCGNTDAAAFFKDPRAGDVVCVRCGIVAGDAEIHDGDWTRSFEGEKKTSQQGPPPDPLLSNRANLGVSLGAGVPGVSAARLQALNMVRAAVDLGTGASASGVSDKRTRIAYKDRMKVHGGMVLASVGELVGASKVTVSRARAIFAAFRDNKEHVVFLEETLAACLIAALEMAIHARLVNEVWAKERGAEYQAAEEAEKVAEDMAAAAVAVEATAFELASFSTGAGAGAGPGAGAGVERGGASGTADLMKPPPPPQQQSTPEEIATRMTAERLKAATDDARAHALGERGPSRFTEWSTMEDSQEEEDKAALDATRAHEAKAYLDAFVAKARGGGGGGVGA
jgi:hypothetical protein